MTEFVIIVSAIAVLGAGVLAVSYWRRTPRFLSSAGTSRRLIARPHPLRRVAILVPGLVRGYEDHGKHTVKLANFIRSRYRCECDVFLCVWDYLSEVDNRGFSTRDFERSRMVDPDRVIAAYQPFKFQLVASAENQRDDPFNPYVFNQWYMVRKCWDLLEGSKFASDYDAIVRSRLDIRPNRRLLKQLGGDKLCVVARHYPPAFWQSAEIQTMRFIDDRVFFGDYDSMKYMCALHDHLADYFDTHLFTAEQRNWLKARDSVLEFGKNDRDYTTRIYAPSEIMLSYHLEVGRKSGLLDATFVTGEFGKMLES